ncbi:MAG TPA: GNAT family N-acetyltransferase [Trueperaceae bacterium]|nr:GNAT family N-acetyltransferase [Trueperaceae bacterium]
MAATPSDPPTLRPLGPADDEATWGLRGLALRESPDAFGSHPDEHPPLEAYRALQAERRRTQEQRAIGAFLDAELVGVVSVVRSPRLKMRHRADLYGLYVAPRARGTGVGRALVRAAVRAANELGAERLELAVTACNAPARHLYEAAGFRAWGTQPRALRSGDRYLDEVYMVLAVTPERGARTRAGRPQRVVTE